MKTFIQIVKENRVFVPDTYDDIYIFISETLKATRKLRSILQFSQLNSEDNDMGRNLFADLILLNSDAEADVLDDIKKNNPRLINMKATTMIAYNAALKIREMLVKCYTQENNFDATSAIRQSMGWIESIMLYCRQHNLYGALTLYLLLYQRLLNIYNGEDI